MKLYDWQEKLYAQWVAAGRRGLLRAVPGAGKTIAGCEIIKRSNSAKTVVVVPTRALLDQWTHELQAQGVSARVLTYATACRHGHGGEIDLLILDEVHRADGLKFRRVFTNFSFKWLLGMSATPTQMSVTRCGPVISDVWFDRAKVSPFKTHFIDVYMDAEEAQKYADLTDKLHSLYMIRDGRYGSGDSMPPAFDSTGERREWYWNRRQLDLALQFTILQRRDVVYKMKSRIPAALKLIRELKVAGKTRILVVCQRVFQAERLYETLSVELPNDVAMYHSRHPSYDDVLDFKAGKKTVMLSVKALNEGFDVPEIDCAVIVSTTLSPARYVQVLGRVARWLPGKESDVYVLLGKATKDESMRQMSTRPPPIEPGRNPDIVRAELLGFFLAWAGAAI
jgi:superfamily II DNA or RNA helicase